MANTFSNGLRQFANKIPKPKQIIKSPQIGAPIAPPIVPNSPVVPTEPMVPQTPSSGNSLIQDALRKRRMLGI